MRRGYRSDYTKPGCDSPRAIANATLFLLNARSLDHVTPESLARQCCLSMKRAEYMLMMARQRREAANG